MKKSKYLNAMHDYNDLWTRLDHSIKVNVNVKSQHLSLC